jgi:flagellar P-ring protein precursor FlgI
MKNLILAVVFVFAAPSFAADASPSTRLKELISVEGIRDNQLIGYGLVVGLAGTGDRRQTVFSAQTLSNMLQRMGVSVPATSLQAKNVAAVMVTGTLAPFAQAGTRMDATVAAMGDAATLQGGLLLMTPLRAANGQVYAVAQGPVVTGGFSAGRGGTSQTVNHPTTGRVPSGAIVELSPPSVFEAGHIRLQLKHGDFTNASRITDAINQRFGAIAKAENSALVIVSVPPSFSGRQVDFVAQLEVLSVRVDRLAKIVINERTGTISIGKDVRIAPVSILHGNLTVEVQTVLEVSQPEPLSKGETIVTPQTTISAKEEQARHINLKDGASVEDLVKALLSIGSTPRDVIAVLQNLQAAGALDAEIEVI